jgi:hypothetical protein
MFVVSPASIALPLVPFSGAMPQPSWTLYKETRSVNWKTREPRIYIKQTLFLTSGIVRSMVREAYTTGERSAEEDCGYVGDGMEDLPSLS